MVELLLVRAHPALKNLKKFLKVQFRQIQKKEQLSHIVRNLHAQLMVHLCLKCHQEYFHLTIHLGPALIVKDWVLIDHFLMIL